MPETTPPEGEPREALVLRARDAWIDRLLDRSRRDPLYYRPLKTGTCIELAGIDLSRPRRDVLFQAREVAARFAAHAKPIASRGAIWKLPAAALPLAG
jgi:hypothetical protein